MRCSAERWLAAPSQVPFQKMADVIAVDKLERRLPERVVPAGQRHGFVLEAQLASLRNHLFGEARGESGVVARVDKKRILAQAGVALDVIGRADGFPHLSQLVERYRRLQALPNVARREAFPNYIGEIGGAVVEYVYLEPGVVNAGEEGIAGAEAGAHDADVLVVFALQPIGAAARVDDGLARRVDGARNVGRDRVVGALQLRRHPVIVVRKTQP